MPTITMSDPHGSHSFQPQSLATARAIATPVNAVGGAFMLHPDTLTPGKAAGYPGGFAYYVVGRGGVLGDVDASVVVSAFAFFAPNLIRSLWEAGVVVEGARKASDRYALACAQWGRQRLGTFAHAERLAELLATVVDQADPSGLALFAGWQTQARVDDALGRCYQLLHVLRELRGSVHIVAIVAHGITPLEALLVNPGSAGEAQAKKFGWDGDFPNADSLQATFAASEEVTNTLMARHLDVLSASEQNELIALVTEVHDIIGR